MRNDKSFTQKVPLESHNFERKCQLHASRYSRKCSLNSTRTRKLTVGQPAWLKRSPILQEPIPGLRIIAGGDASGSRMNNRVGGQVESGCVSSRGAGISSAEP